MIPGILVWSSSYFIVQVLRLLFVLFGFSSQELPQGEYVFPIYTIHMDTLISAETILRYVPDWDGERLGIDVRYLLDSSNTRQCTFLAGSELLVFSDSDTVPMVCQLEGQPVYFSISRSGLFALIYQQIDTFDSARFLNRVDLRTGTIVDFKVLISDKGKIAVPRFLDAFQQVYICENSSWREIDIRSEYLTAAFISQAGNRLLQCSRDQGGLILTTDLDTLDCFDSGRAYLKATLSNSGNTVLYSSTNGISVYYSESGEVDGQLYNYSGVQAPVVSASDSCWSCVFRNNDQEGPGGYIVISGKVEDIDNYNVLYSSEAAVRTLAVSDHGDVLCTQQLTDPRLDLAYRYLVVNRSGHVVWASEFKSPFFFFPRPSGNALMSNTEIKPKLADISAQGYRWLLWNDGQVVEYSIDVGEILFLGRDIGLM